MNNRAQVFVELPLRECYQMMPLEAVSEEDWLLLTLSVIAVLNDITNLRHNAFAMSSGWNKIVSAFHLFRCLFTIKSANIA